MQRGITGWGPRPLESVITEEIYLTRRMCVVRLMIRQIVGGVQKNGYGTGFVAYNNQNARKLLVMTCAHLFDKWISRSLVDVIFHDNVIVQADVRAICRRQEVAVLCVRPVEFVLAYPPVTFHFEALKSGALVVMLGYPFAQSGELELGRFSGSVINEAGLSEKTRNAALNKRLVLVQGDYAAAGGSSGAPVFRAGGGELAGISVSGGKDMCCFVPVSEIQNALRDAEEVKASKLQVNASIEDIFVSCFDVLPTRAMQSSGSAKASGSGTASGSGR